MVTLKCRRLSCDGTAVIPGTGSLTNRSVSLRILLGSAAIGYVVYALLIYWDNDMMLSLGTFVKFLICVIGFNKII